MRTLLTFAVIFCSYLGIAEESKIIVKDGDMVAFLGQKRYQPVLDPERRRLN